MKYWNDFEENDEDVLVHTDDYHGDDFIVNDGVCLQHWKYIDRIFKNGKWKYIYQKAKKALTGKNGESNKKPTDAERANFALLNRIEAQRDDPKGYQARLNEKNAAEARMRARHYTGQREALAWTRISVANERKKREESLRKHASVATSVARAQKAANFKKQQQERANRELSKKREAAATAKIAKKKRAEEKQAAKERKARENGQKELVKVTAKKAKAQRFKNAKKQSDNMRKLKRSLVKRNIMTKASKLMSGIKDIYANDVKDKKSAINKQYQKQKLQSLVNDINRKAKAGQKQRIADKAIKDKKAAITKQYRKQQLQKMVNRINSEAKKGLKQQKKEKAAKDRAEAIAKYKKQKNSVIRKKAKKRFILNPKAEQRRKNLYRLLTKGSVRG